MSSCAADADRVANGNGSKKGAVGGGGDVELVVRLEVAQGDVRAELVTKGKIGWLGQWYTTGAEAVDAEVYEVFRKSFCEGGRDSVEG